MASSSEWGDGWLHCGEATCSSLSCYLSWLTVFPPSWRGLPFLWSWQDGACEHLVALSPNVTGTGRFFQGSLVE